MAVFETKVTINKPVDIVWKAFIDESIVDKWLTGFKKGELIEGEMFKVGNKYRMTFEENGREFIMVEELSVFSEKEEYTFLIDSKVMKGKNQILFLEKDESTIIESIFEFHGKGLWKFLMPLSKKIMKERQEGDFVKFKNIVEAM